MHWRQYKGSKELKLHITRCVFAQLVERPPHSRKVNGFNPWPRHTKRRWKVGVAATLFGRSGDIWKRDRAKVDLALLSEWRAHDQLGKKPFLKSIFHLRDFRISETNKSLLLLLLLLLLSKLSRHAFSKVQMELWFVTWSQRSICECIINICRFHT